MAPRRTGRKSVALADPPQTPGEKRRSGLSPGEDCDTHVAPPVAVHRIDGWPTHQDGIAAYPENRVIR